MGSTGITTKKSFDDVFREEFGTELYNMTIRRYHEMKVPPPFETGVTEESEFFLATYRDGYIGCDVIIFKRYIHEVVYKIMSDTEGPYTVTKCPEDIMKLLSPIEEYGYVGHADEFRKRQL